MTCRSLVALALVVAAAGCVGGSSYEAGDSLCQPGAQPATFARNPATGMCIGFASSCDVPAEWASCIPLTPCTIDDECAPTQHCVDQPISMEPDAPARACTDNDACTVESGCDGGLFCDLGVAGGGEGMCDPALPDCVPAGTCSRGSSAPMAPPGCLATSECGALEICPAQYGGCSPGTSGDVACPSVCEPACLTDADCGDPATSGLRCNAEQICGPSTPDARGDDGLACAGWCEPG